MLKFSRGKLIVFDIEEALSFEGETGPYLQYAVVRANNIFHKLQEREGVSEADVIRALDTAEARELTDDPAEPTDHDLWAVVLEAARLEEVVDQVVRSLEFSVLAKYAFGLAQLFNAFYHRYPILNEEDVHRKRWRAAGVAYFRAQLTVALDLMGIEVPSADVDPFPRGMRIEQPRDPCVFVFCGEQVFAMALIGITSCQKIEDYRQAILHAGGEVRVVDPAMSVEDALAGLGGVMMTGGETSRPTATASSRIRPSSTWMPRATSSSWPSSPRRVSGTCRCWPSAAACRS